MDDVRFEEVSDDRSVTDWQRIHNEIIPTDPLSLDDVVFAEWVWAASKSVVSTTAILIVIMLLGFGHSWLAIWILPLGFLIGLNFSAFGEMAALEQDRARAEIQQRIAGRAHRVEVGDRMAEQEFRFG